MIPRIKCYSIIRTFETNPKTLCQYQTIFYFTANQPTAHEGGSGGDDSPSSHDSGLGGNITGMMSLSGSSLNCEGGIPVDAVNIRTDSATPPPSNSSNEMEIFSLKGIEQNMDDCQPEGYIKLIQGQRMNNSSPLSCPSSPLTVGKIHSTPSAFNNGLVADTSSSCTRSMPVQNNLACQTVNVSDWPTNFAGLFLY